MWDSGFTISITEKTFQMFKKRLAHHHTEGFIHICLNVQRMPPYLIAGVNSLVN